MEKKNILLTLMSLQIGGAETHVVELAKGLKRHGYHVVVASYGGIFEKELSAHGIKHYHVPLQNKKLKNVIASYRMLKKIIDEEHIDLVHAHARIPAVISGRICRQKGIPFVTTAHGIRATGLIWKYLTDWGEKTVAVSEDVRKNLIEVYGVKPENIVLTINGIDVDQFSPDAKPVAGFCSEKKKLVYLSRLDVDRKDIALQVMEAAAYIKEQEAAFEAILVGNGDAFGALQTRAKEINERFHETVITLPGETSETNAYIALADVFVGFGRSCLEALSGARPVLIASPYGYSGLFGEDKLEICLLNNFSGRGEAAVRPEQLAQDVMDVLHMSDGARQTICNYGRRLILERYSTDRMTEDNLMAYEQLLEKR